MLECYVIKAAGVGRDALHQSFYWDISQNVNMSQCSNRSGVVGCLTPGGWPFFPHLGRVLLGQGSNPNSYSSHPPREGGPSSLT